MSDPAQVAGLLREHAGRTTTRAELARRHPDLSRVSPRVGVLDETTLTEDAATDPDGAVELLADLVRATDPALRARARRLAVRLLVPPSRSGPAGSRGATRLATVAGEGLDLDLDATLERASAHRPVRAEDLRWRAWRSPGRAVVLLVDASGSVAGAPLTTALTTVGALAAGMRGTDELAVVAFWSRAVVLRDVGSPRPVAAVLDAVGDLRAGSTTDLALGLRVALDQAAAARSPRADVLVLTDGVATAGADPASVAAAAGAVRVSTLLTVDTADARAACDRIAVAGGGRRVDLLRPSSAPAAVDAALR